MIRDGLEDGELLITSNIQTPVQGMELRLEGDMSDSSSVSRKPGADPDSGDSFIGKFDTDGDGLVSREEFDGPPMVFDMFDKDSNGYIKIDEAPDGPPTEDLLPDFPMDKRP